MRWYVRTSPITGVSGGCGCVTVIGAAFTGLLAVVAVSYGLVFVAVFVAVFVVAAVGSLAASWLFEPALPGIDEDATPTNSPTPE
jgi:hypothetical protein